MIQADRHLMFCLMCSIRFNLRFTFLKGHRQPLQQLAANFSGCLIRSCWGSSGTPSGGHGCTRTARLGDLGYDIQFSNFSIRCQRLGDGGNGENLVQFDYLKPKKPVRVKKRAFPYLFWNNSNNEKCISYNMQRIPFKSEHIPREHQECPFCIRPSVTASFLRFTTSRVNDSHTLRQLHRTGCNGYGSPCFLSRVFFNCELFWTAETQLKSQDFSQCLTKHPFWVDGCQVTGWNSIVVGFFDGPQNLGHNIFLSVILYFVERNSKLLSPFKSECRLLEGSLGPIKRTKKNDTCCISKSISAFKMFKVLTKMSSAGLT